MTPLKKKRISVGIKQCALAVKAGNISISNFSRYENGWARPSLYTASRIAKALNCEISEIFPELEGNSDD
jgi:transcriptional regulator with XRE-family HTH domain